MSLGFSPSGRARSADAHRFEAAPSAWYVDLARRVIDVIVAAYHVRDAHVGSSTTTQKL
jgi:hypothetical protein